MDRCVPPSCRCRLRTRRASPSCCGAQTQVSLPDDGGADARRHLQAIARQARPAGSDAETQARSYCAHELRSRGFTVTEEPFEYSMFPGRWATPLAGAGACLTIATAGALGAAGHALRSVAVLVAMLLIGTTLAIWMARRGVLRIPLLRARAINLVATRGAPRVWLIAHLDSKSQPIPMLARVAGIVGSTLALLALLALGAAAHWGIVAPKVAWLAVAVIGMLASVPVIASTVGDASAGAIDDASGVAAVLCAAARLPATANVGVALMSAEELGMAGAWAFAVRRAGGVALNVDGVDDAGTFLCMMHGGRSTASDAVDSAARALSCPIRFGPTVPGILTDGVALANAGWSAVTLSRGSFATLARVHRAADNLDRLRGAGIGAMARILATAAQEIV